MDPKTDMTESPYQSPTQPIELSLESQIQSKDGAHEQRIAGRKDTWEQRRDQVVVAQHESLGRQQHKSGEITPPPDKAGQ